MAELGFYVKFICTETENEKWLDHQVYDVKWYKARETEESFETVFTNWFKFIFKIYLPFMASFLVSLGPE